MDKLNALRSFRRIVELGSFRAAASDLGLTHAAVSKQVGELERQLGATLLVRTTRRLMVTEAGRDYYQRCARILDDLSEADAAVGSLQGVARGRLRVNSPMSFGLLHLAPAVAEFMALYPEVTVDLVMNDRFVDLIEDGFDVGVRGGQLPVVASLKCRLLAPVRRVVCAAPIYLERSEKLDEPSDLVSHRCIVYSAASSPTDWKLTSKSGSEEVVSVAPYYAVNSSIAVRDALVRGVGVALVPTFVVGDDLRNGRLVPVLKSYTAAPKALHVVYPAARHLTPKVRALVDFLVGRFGGTPPWDLNL